MNSFKFFITVFCTSCTVLGVLYILVPKGALNKSVKYIFCLCFVCCVIGSVVAIPQPDFSDFERIRSEDILNTQNVSVTAQLMFCKALESKNINFRKVVVDTNKTKDGSIIISKVTVYTSEAPQKIVELIGSDSYEVMVVNE